MKSAFWRSLAVVALVAIPMMANANDATIGSEAAYSSMSGASLMNTTAIFNVFPHMAVENGTGVELDTANDGQGRVWWEAYDNLWVNMTAGRMDLGLAGTGYMWGGALQPFGGTAVFEDFNWMNLGIARPIAGGGAWALGFMAAPFGGFNTTAAGVDDELNMNGYGFNGSWGNGDGMNLSAEFAYTKVEDNDNVAATSDEFKNTGFGVSGRYDTDLYIYQANVFYSKETDSGNSFPDDEETTGTGFMLSASRFVKNDTDGQATVECGFGYVKDQFDVGAFSDETTTVVFPGVRVAAWQSISDRFGLMGGLGWGHLFGKEDDGTTEDKVRFSDYEWSAGVFFQPNDNVRIDGRFQEGNLNQVASLGNQQPLLMYLGMTVGLN